MYFRRGASFIRGVAPSFARRVYDNRKYYKQKKRETGGPLLSSGPLIAPRLLSLNRLKDIYI